MANRELPFESQGQNMINCFFFCFAMSALSPPRICIPDVLGVSISRHVWDQDPCSTGKHLFPALPV